MLPVAHPKAQTAYRQAEDAYLELLRLFPNQPKKSGKKRFILNTIDFFRTVGQISGNFGGERILPKPRNIEVMERGRLSHTFKYQFHSFSDDAEDIFVASILNPSSGEFIFLFNPTEEECILPWLSRVLDYLLLDRPPPDRYIP